VTQGQIHEIAMSLRQQVSRLNRAVTDSQPTPPATPDEIADAVGNRVTTSNRKKLWSRVIIGILAVTNVITILLYINKTPVSFTNEQVALFVKEMKPVQVKLDEEKIAQLFAATIVPKITFTDEQLKTIGANDKDVFVFDPKDADMFVGKLKTALEKGDLKLSTPSSAPAALPTVTETKVVTTTATLTDAEIKEFRLTLDALKSEVENKQGLTANDLKNALSQLPEITAAEIQKSIAKGGIVFMHPEYGPVRLRFAAGNREDDEPDGEGGTLDFGPARVLWEVVK
jgi:hypothetical protein